MLLGKRIVWDVGGFVQLGERKKHHHYPSHFIRQSSTWRLISIRPHLPTITLVSVILINLLFEIEKLKICGLCWVLSYKYSHDTNINVINCRDEERGTWTKNQIFYLQSHVESLGQFLVEIYGLELERDPMKHLVLCLLLAGMPLHNIL